MRNPRFLLWAAAFIVLVLDGGLVTAMASHAIARTPSLITSACLPAPSGSVVKPKGRHVNGRAPVSDLA